jgi:hypothetical protein
MTQLVREQTSLVPKRSQRCLRRGSMQDLAGLSRKLSIVGCEDKKFEPPASVKIPGCEKYFWSPFRGEVTLALDTSER